MEARFYTDPETGYPHIHNHAVAEHEGEQVLLLLARIDQDEMTRGSLSDRPTQDVTSELSMSPEPYRILFS